MKTVGYITNVGRIGAARELVNAARIIIKKKAIKFDTRFDQENRRVDYVRQNSWSRFDIVEMIAGEGMGDLAGYDGIVLSGRSVDGKVWVAFRTATGAVKIANAHVNRLARGSATRDEAIKLIGQLSKLMEYAN